MQRTTARLTEADRRKAFATLALGALGVVFGDIGTSPLYTIQHDLRRRRASPSTEANVLGVLSLVFWSLVIVVSLKYVVLHHARRQQGRGRHHGADGAGAARRCAATRALRCVDRRCSACFGASLFYGDGVITPAISVLGAVEGLKVAAPDALRIGSCRSTLVILLVLFAVQSRGTAQVGAVFGPIMLLWFVVDRGARRSRRSSRQPHVLCALNPCYGLEFFRANGWHGFLALGGVVLAITGGEALYADMGHFGKNPIRCRWFGLRAAGAGAELFRPGRVAAGQSRRRSTIRSITLVPRRACCSR